MKSMTLTASDIDGVSKSANIPVTPDEKKTLAAGFTQVLTVLDQLKKVDVAGMEPTNRGTVHDQDPREDEIDTTRMFTQEEALANAPKSHNGFFVVERVLNET